MNRERALKNALRDLRRFRKAKRITVGYERAKYAMAVRNLTAYVEVLKNQLKGTPSEKCIIEA